MVFLVSTLLLRGLSFPFCSMIVGEEHTYPLLTFSLWTGSELFCNRLPLKLVGNRRLFVYKLLTLQGSKMRYTWIEICKHLTLHLGMHSVIVRTGISTLSIFSCFILELILVRWSTNCLSFFISELQKNRWFEASLYSKSSCESKSVRRNDKFLQNLCSMRIVLKLTTRSRIWNLAVSRRNTVLLLCSSRVKTRHGAYIASRALKSSNPMSWVTYLAAEPCDVYWSNLCIPLSAALDSSTCDSYCCHCLYAVICPSGRTCTNSDWRCTSFQRLTIF